MERIKLARDTKDMKVQEAYEKFIRIKKAKNLAEDTIKHYAVGYRYFSEFFDVSCPCTDISIDTYYEYIEYLQKNKNANSVTMNTYLGALRTILYFFMEEGYINHFDIKLLKKEKQIKETYTDKELEKLLKKPDLKKCNFTEYRNWAMVNYFLGTGNRLRTALNLKIGDLDFDNYLILMGKTKNGRQQLIPMSKSLATVLQEYLVHRGGGKDDYVFCNTHGGQLTRDGTSTLIRKYNKNRGVERTSIHAFRHTFAKNWILNGGDIFRLQKILGHSSIDMVRNYVEMFSDDLKQDFEVYNPLDNLVKNNKTEAIRMRKRG